MRCWCTSVPLVWSTASEQGTLQCRSCKDGDGALTSLPAGCSGVLVSFFGECYFSNFGTRLRADHRSSLCASRLVTDIASALADGSEHSVFGQKCIFRTLTHSNGRNRRGYLDFIGGRPPRQWTDWLSSSSSWYSNPFTQSIDLSSLVLDSIYMVLVVATVDLSSSSSSHIERPSCAGTCVFTISGELAIRLASG